MDRNELLASVRAEFLRSFVEGVEFSMPLSMEGLFKKADRSLTSIAQRRYLDARSVLQNQFADLRHQMQKCMEKMLNRSFQTTYSKYRPAFPTSILDGSVSLVDTATFEDELRFNDITERFRNEAEEQLRDLNIRIALLFEQDNIRERENPFRPYIFSRTIAMAVESLGKPTDLNNILTEQLAENFSGCVAKIYAVVNAHLAQHGIAAQLLLKTKRPTSAPPFIANNNAGQERDEESPSGRVQNSPIGNSGERVQYQIVKREASAEVPKNPVERLLNSVKAMASNLYRHPSDSGSTSREGRRAGQGASNGVSQARGNSGGAFSGGISQPGGNAGGTYPGGMSHAGGYAGGGGSGGMSPAGGYAGGDSSGGISPAGGYAGGGGSGGMSAAGGYAGGGGSGGISPAGGYAGGGGSGGMSAASGYAGGGGSGGMSQMDGNMGAAGGTDGMPQTARSSGEGGNGLANSGWISGKQIVGDVLRKFFSGNSTQDDFGSGESDQIGKDSGNGRPAIGQLAGSVQRLLRQDTPLTEDMFNTDGEVRNLIMERRSNLNDMAHDLKEQMTIDIVAMLFEFILRDTQVPAEVRAQLGRLQFLVLKVALRDDSLLTKKAHPARMLVNRIGSISLGLKQIDPGGANVTVEICRIVAELLADETENPGLFSKMLDDLDAFIAHELLVNDKNVSRAVEVVVQAESRTLRFAHTTAQMREALSGLTFSGNLKTFFENDWVRAIELADRTNSELANRYRLLVPDLLWSILPKLNEDDRQRLLAMLPTILKTMHEGMNLVGWEASDKQTLMDWLFDTHTVMLRGSNLNVPTSSLSSTHNHFKKFVENPEMSPPATDENETSSDRKKFLAQAMKESDVRIQLLDEVFDQDRDLPEEPAVDDASSRDAARESEATMAERLRIGVAIEVNLGGKNSIGRLNWINPNASNLVLTLNGQAEPFMISVRMFQRLISNERVRFLEIEPIFERAVDSLLVSASQVD